MGYIFDALNRAGDEEPTKPPVDPGSLDGDQELSPPPPQQERSANHDDEASAVNFELTAPTPIDTQANLPEPEPEEIASDVLEEVDATPDDSSMPQPQAPFVFSENAAPAKVKDLAQPKPLILSPQWIEQIDDRLVTLTDPGSIMAEEYRAIRTSLLARWQHKRHLVHTITSATPQEGKTITSLNLGLSFAELRNRRTIVVEADLRLPTFDKLLRLGPSEGLMNYLQGEADLDQVIQKLGDDGLEVITAGGRANNDSVQLLSSQRMSELFDLLRQRYDHVIIDTPPVVELADAGILGAMSDDVLLIARMNRTPRTLIEQAIRTLASYNAPVAGMIATDQQRLRRRYHYYRYGYRYRYRYYNKQAA